MQYVKDLQPGKRSGRFKRKEFLDALRKDEWLKIGKKESKEKFGVSELYHVVLYHIKQGYIQEKLVVNCRKNGNDETFYARLT